MYTRKLRLRKFTHLRDIYGAPTLGMFQVLGVQQGVEQMKTSPSTLGLSGNQTVIQVDGRCGCLNPPGFPGVTYSGCLTPDGSRGATGQPSPEHARSVCMVID